VALFAFALSRPFLSQVASYASECSIALAIVLDDSMSMARSAMLTETLFDAARARAEQVVSELAPDSEVVVVLGGREPRVLAGRTSDLPALTQELSRLERTGAR